MRHLKIYNLAVSLSDVDLGKTLLTVSLLLGFFLLVITIIRTVEIGIKIYLDKKKLKQSKEPKQINQKRERGF